MPACSQPQAAYEAALRTDTTRGHWLASTSRAQQTIIARIPRPLFTTVSTEPMAIRAASTRHAVNVLRALTRCAIPAGTGNWEDLARRATEKKPHLHEHLRDPVKRPRERSVIASTVHVRSGRNTTTTTALHLLVVQLHHMQSLRRARLVRGFRP